MVPSIAMEPTMFGSVVSRAIGPPTQRGPTSIRRAVELDVIDDEPSRMRR